MMTSAGHHVSSVTTTSQVQPTYLSLPHAVIAVLREAPVARTVPWLIDTLNSLDVLPDEWHNVTQLHTKVVDALDDLGDYVIRSQGPAPQYQWGYVASKATYDGPTLPSAKAWRRAVLKVFRNADRGVALSIEEITSRVYILVDIKHGNADGLYPAQLSERAVINLLPQMMLCGDLECDAFLYTMTLPMKCKVCEGHCPADDFAYCVECALDTDADMCRECGRRGALHAADDDRKRAAAAKVVEPAKDAEPAHVTTGSHADVNKWGPIEAYWNPAAMRGSDASLVPWCLRCDCEVKPAMSASLVTRTTMTCACCGQDFREQDSMWLTRIGMVVERMQTVQRRKDAITARNSEFTSPFRSM